MIEVNRDSIQTIARVVSASVAQRVARRARVHSEGRFEVGVRVDDRGVGSVNGHGLRAFQLEYGPPEEPGAAWAVRSVMGDVE